MKNILSRVLSKVLIIVISVVMGFMFYDAYFITTPSSGDLEQIKLQNHAVICEKKATSQNGFRLVLIRSDSYNFLLPKIFINIEECNNVASQLDNEPELNISYELSSPNWEIIRSYIGTTVSEREVMGVRGVEKVYINTEQSINDKYSTKWLSKVLSTVFWAYAIYVYGSYFFKRYRKKI